MKLLLRRDQKTGGMLSKSVTFTLDVRAELSAAEVANIQKYKLGEAVLYERDTIVDRGSGLLGVASRALHKALNISISVNDLANGKRVECKDIIEMLAVEEQVKEAAEMFKNVLSAAAGFGGEQVLEL
jgi:hypothetical protein